MNLLSTIRGIVTGRSAEPFCNANTFFVWEPCSTSHAEVVPGFARYLLDAGYEVSVLLTPDRIDEGLFDRFQHPRLHLNRLSQRQIRAHFRRNGLGVAAGIMVTTAGKLSRPGDYAAEFGFFGQLQHSQRVILVEHDVKAGCDRGTLTPRIVTLREVHHATALTTPISPHHFGDVPLHEKGGIARFATIGAMRSKRRNSELLVEAASRLLDAGIDGFAVDVVGKGGLRGIPSRLSERLLVHGRVSFTRMYEVVSGADFLLPLLDPGNPSHLRYITTGTSGTIQLAYGFAKPCVIEGRFAEVNGFRSENAIVYDGNERLSEAMRAGIMMTPEEYAAIRDRLKADARELAAVSMCNLRALLA